MSLIREIIFKAKDYFHKNKVTFMVVPKTQKSIKQWNFNIAIAFSILIMLIILNIALMTTTLASKIQSSLLTSENKKLSSDLKIQTDKVTLLEDINALKAEEITVLKSSLEETLVYVDQRLKELEEVQENVATLVTMFNKETNSNIQVPISRSFNRFYNGTAVDLISDEPDVIGQVEFLVNNNEISELILAQKDEYSDLINSLQSQMSYLSCRPDFYPTNGKITSPFGYRRDPLTGKTAKHTGVDIANSKGTNIFSAADGVVIFTGWNGSYGNVIIIDHGYDYKTVYAHLNQIKVSKGSSVKKGDKIATMGSTGKSTGTHLHFEIIYKGVQTNPLNLIKK